MNSPKTIDVIRDLKDVREAEGLSVAEIVRRVKASGSAVSETVIRRVFADNSETKDSFVYDTSIKPIAKVLLTSDKETAQVNALVNIIGLKNEQIEKRDEEIEKLYASIDKQREQFEALCAEYRSRIEFLRGQIEKKDEYMGKKDAIIERLLDELHPVKI